MREDGRVRVSFTACTGLCDQGPAALVNGFPLVHLDRQRVEQITALVESQTPLSDWPGEWFEVDEPVWQRGLLLDAPQASGEALQAVVAAGADGFLTQLEQSGLRGRGGAGFSTWEKLWRSCREASGQHYVVCNADEGEPGTFKDRLLLDHHADAVLEGMTIAGYVLGARKGLIYLRYEYAFLHAQLQAQLDQRRRQQLLGRSILGMEGFDFDIEIHLGAGAYVCGEESALIESLEGKRGVPRIRPPFPVTCGYRNQPTLVNNVETFACVEWIARQGGEAFAAEGTASSAGHKLHSISGDCRQPGIYELPWGCTLRELLAACGGENAAYVQVGGPSGTLVDASQFDRRLEFDDLATGGSLMVIGSERNLFELLHNFARFFHHESCGFCVPCRAGCQELRQIATQLVEQRALPKDLERIRALDLTLGASHCGLGRTATRPLAQALVLAEPLFRQQLGQADQPAFDLAAATAEARHLRKPS